MCTGIARYIESQFTGNGQDQCVGCEIGIGQVGSDVIFGFALEMIE